MRIRKGHRCLPLAPADRSLTLQQARWSHGAIGQAAMVAVGDMIGPQCQVTSSMLWQQRATADTSMERKDSLEYDLEWNRAPVDDKFNESSGLMNRDTGAVAPTVMKLAETLVKEERSPSTRHPPSCESWTIAGSSTSATETRDEPNLLGQSLRHVCGGAGMSGTSADNAVAQIIEQGPRGLSEGGAGLTEQVTNSFRNSSKSVDGEEPGKYVSQRVHNFPETKSLIIEESGVGDVKKTVPSSEIVEVAKQLQNLHSFSRGSGAGEWSEAQSDDRHGSKRKAVASIPEGEFDSETEYDDDDMAENENSSVRYRSQKVMHIDEDLSDSRCKRDDGKGWRCCWPAEDGYTMCAHHRRRAISQGKCQRKKGSRLYLERSSPASRSPPVYVANSRVHPGVDKMPAASCWSPFLDEELAHDEHRQFLKAKSMKSLLSKPPRKFSRIRRGGV